MNEKPNLAISLRENATERNPVSVAIKRVPITRSLSRRGDGTRPAAPVHAPLASACLAAAVEDYALEAQLLRHSPRTVEKKRAILGKLLWFASTRCHDELGPPALRAFFLYLSASAAPEGGRWGKADETKPVGSETVKTYHTVIRAFFRWMVTEGRLGVSPLITIKPPISRPDQIQPFAPEQVLALLRAASQSAYPCRDTALLYVLLDTGIRLAELCALTHVDVNLSEGEIVVRSGKGGKRRVVPISRKTRQALYALQSEMGDFLPGDAVFVSERGRGEGRGLLPNAVAKLLKRLNNHAKVGGVRVSPHTFRHTFAVMFLRSGGQVFTLKQILGHESLSMTNRYVAVAQADVTAQHRQFSPVDALIGGKRKGNGR